MIFRSAAVTAFVLAAALSAPAASGFTVIGTCTIGSLPCRTDAISNRASPHYAGIPADVPMWSDDVTGGGNGRTRSSSSLGGIGSYSNGPNPLNVKYTEVMLRQAYDEWKVAHGKTETTTTTTDNNNNKFAVFKLNYLQSQRAHALQTARAKMANMPLPAPLEMNAYADCTPQEYQQLLVMRDQQSNHVAEEMEMQSTKMKDADDATVSSSSSASSSLEPSVSYSIPADRRGPLPEQSALTSFPQRTTIPTTVTAAMPKNNAVPTPAMFDGLKRATQNLATSSRSASSVSVSAADNKTNKKTILDPSATTTAGTTTAATTTNKVTPAPTKTTFNTSQTPATAAATAAAVSKTAPMPSMASYRVKPDNAGSFGNPSASYFPKRTIAHEATSKNTVNTTDIDTASTLKTPKISLGSSSSSSSSYSSYSSSTPRVQPDVFYKDQSRLATNFPKRTPSQQDAPIIPLVRAAQFRDDDLVVVETNTNDDTNPSQEYSYSPPPAPKTSVSSDQQRGATAAPFSFKRQNPIQQQHQQKIFAEDLPPPEYIPPVNKAASTTTSTSTTPPATTAPVPHEETANEDPQANDSTTTTASSTVETLPKEVSEEIVQSERVIPLLQDLLKAEMDASNKENDAESAPPPSPPPPPPPKPTLEAAANQVKYRAEAEARMKQWKALQANLAMQQQQQQPQQTVGNDPMEQYPVPAVAAKNRVRVVPPRSTADIQKQELAQRSLLQRRMEIELACRLATRATQEAEDVTVDLELDKAESATSAASNTKIKEPAARHESSTSSRTVVTEPKKDRGPPVKKASIFGPEHSATAPLSEIERTLQSGSTSSSSSSAEAAAHPESGPQEKAVVVDATNSKETVGAASTTATTTACHPRQKEIEDALKADFGVAALSSSLATDRLSVEAIERAFEGTGVGVDLIASEGAVAAAAAAAAAALPPVYYDPFAISPAPGISRTPLQSIQDVLQSEMEAAKSLVRENEQTVAEKAAAASRTPGIAVTSPSIETILKEEREAAERLKQSSSAAQGGLEGDLEEESNNTPDTPAMSNRQRKFLKWKESLKTKKKNKQNNKGTKNESTE